MTLLLREVVLSVDILSSVLAAGTSKGARMHTELRTYYPPLGLNWCRGRGIAWGGMLGRSFGHPGRPHGHL